MTPTLDTASLDAAVVRLTEATRTGVPCAPVRDLVGRDDVDAAYAVQRRVAELRRAGGARVVGRKIGLTAPAVQAQLGVDRPDFGLLFDDMQVSTTVSVTRLLQPKVEAEVAFVLSDDLDDPGATARSVRTAVAHAVAAIEIVDSRIADWDISFGDTVADNASSGLFVLGEQRVTLDAFEPRDVTMTLLLDGRPASHGRGDACLGDPLAALAWLAATASRLGDPLRAGDVVLSGALGPMVPVAAGNAVRAEIDPLGPVEVHFVGGEQ